jgi:CubicO group peptidase (beta-lactamase class C family)
MVECTTRVAFLNGGTFMGYPKRKLKRAALTAITTSLALTGLGIPAAQSVLAGTITSNTVESTIDSIIQQAVSNGNFSGEVLVEKHGTILLDKAYGSSNLGRNTPNTLQNRFAIGSITQTFAAAAIMQLVETGKIHLDDPVGKYLPNSNEAGNYITIRELLTHTSGAPVLPTSPPAQPGSVFQYSPLNYEYLGNIIQNVTGEPVQTYIQQNILSPLGMSNTGFITTSMSAVPNAATGYTQATQGKASVIDFAPGQMTSAFGMYSTVDDLFKWDQALYGSSVVSSSSIKQIFTPNPVSEQTIKSKGYGYGWYVSLDGTVALSEDVADGFSSFICRDMSKDETVILLSNQQWSPLENIGAQLLATANSTSMSTAPLANSIGGQKQISANGKTLSKPFSRIGQGTTFMPIWYIGKALESVGIQQNWDGNNQVFSMTLPSSFKADFSNIPVGTGNTDIIVNGMLVKRMNAYAWPDPANGNKSNTVYAPIFYVQQILQAAGIANNWNGSTWSTAK